VLSNAEAIEKFKEIIGSQESWQDLKESQFVNHMAIFQAWAMSSAQYAVERAVQETFLSTALNAPSIRAHAEDRGYVPRKACPSVGTISVKNNGSNDVVIPANQPFRANVNSGGYLVKEPVTIQPAATVTAAISQLLRSEAIHTVTAEKPYYEILFDASVTGTISQIDVFVDPLGGTEYVEWQSARMFQNTLSDSTVFDEFYTHNGQIGIRFGNGEFGQVLPIGASVQCVLWVTDGPTVLLQGQPLIPCGAILDNIGAAASLEIMTASQITGGEPAETGDELRRSLMYWPLYQEQLVWKEDYEFFLKNKFPEILWINVWGEAEAEAAAGRSSVDFVNKIFVSAYAQNNEQIGQDILDELQGVKLLNRKFQWVAPVVVYFTVSITGCISSKYSPVTVSAAITAGLNLNYGINSRARRPEVLIKDVYSIIEATGYFADGDYTVTLSGAHDANAINEIVAIDPVSTVIALTNI